jgi:hypothetical protein
MKNSLKLVLFPVALLVVVMTAAITAFVACILSIYGDWGYKKEWEFWAESNRGNLKAIIPFYEP